jgi:hypothetical protein
MKQLYAPVLLLLLIFFSGCSKDFLKRYDNRIIGTWRIADVNRIGLGGDSDNLPFRAGNLTFNDDGSLVYVDQTGTTYQGHWDIVKKRLHQDDVQRTLQISVVNFGNQQLLTQYYDDMNFWGTDYFKATIQSGFHTYVTHFRR